MKKIIYLIKRIFEMDYKKFFNTINEIHIKTNKNKLLLFFDIILCGIIYQAGYSDYLLFEMYNLNRKERKKILTRGKNNYYISKLNPKKYWDIVDNKEIFNNRFSKYLKREYMVINEDNFDLFKSFCSRHQEIIVKPIAETCGFKVEKIDVKKEDLSTLYTHLLANKQYLIEEVVSQNEKIAKLHKESINTIRIITINYNNKITIVAAVLRIGTGKNIVDNFHKGGVCAPIDIDNGLICDKACDKKGNYYDKHPDTNITFKGFKIPMWDEVKNLVISAAKDISELGIIGFDVAISKSGPCLIEANQYPAYDLYRMVKTPNDIGMVQVFKNAISK